MKFISLKFKLLLSCVIISVVLTFLLSVFEINKDINRYVTDLEFDLAQIESSHRNYLSNKTWAMEYDSLESFVNDQVDDRKINFIKIIDTRGSIIAHAGKPLTANSKTHQFDLTYYHNDTTVNIGSVFVGGNIPSYKEQIQSRWLDLLFVNGLLVLIIFTTSYLIFYKQVLARLTAIKEFAETDSLENFEKDYFLTIGSGISDEITLLSNALIERNQLIRKEFQKRVEAEKELIDNNTALSLEIEERVIAEQKLEQSQSKFQAIFSSITDAVVFVDTARQISMINPAFTKLFGYSFEEVKGRTTEFFYANKDSYKEQGANRYTETVGSKKPIYENKYRKKNGSVFAAETLGVPVKNANKKLVGYLGIMRDLTDRNKEEEEKRSLENRLRQAQKMEAIGTLAGGIAHDFNNILGAILGYAEMAKDDSEPGSTISKDLSEVLEAGNRAKSLVRQILAFSRQDDAERMALQPASIVKETIAMLRPSLPTTIEITHDIDAATGLLFIDPTQLNQILMNLCTNAFHAMEETGGKLDISLKEVALSKDNLTHEPDVTVGTFIQLSIGDTGTGVTPTVKDKIFDPYFTTKEAGKGTGMGLAMVHGIVKNYGGFISLDSELGKGTVFHVFLPTVKKEALTENKMNDQTPTGKERILFVDDEEILANMGKTMLERLGYHVTVRKSSLEALEIFQNQPDKFDLVITDQTMPGMTGSDLSRRMLQIRPEIPIILCTGYSTIMSEEKAKSMGIKEFAFKPLTKQDIAKLIRKVLDVS